MKAIAGWSLLIGTAVSMPFLFCNIGFEWPLLYAALCTFYYLAGKYFYGKEAHFWLRPFQTTAFLGACGLTLMYTYEWINSWGLKHIHHDKLSLIAVILVTLASLVFIVLLIRKRSYINIFPASTVLIISILQFLSENSYLVPAEIIANFFLLAFGIYYIWKGISSKNIYLVNLGMFFVASQAITRFFESDLNFLIKGVAFIVVGLGFLTANLFINRRLKKNED